MIGGQAVFISQIEENFIPVVSEIELSKITETGATINETVGVEKEAKNIDLKPKFARLKKAMRKRSVSIF